VLLKDKAAAFINQENLLVDAFVGTSSIFKIPIAYNYKLKSSLFESNVTISSDIFGRRGRVFIGAYSNINNGGYLRIDQGDVFIGRYCSVGRRVTVAAGIHNMFGLTTSTKIQCPNPQKTRKIPRRITLIESDVWIGDGAVIMPGVKLGVGCIVGANAVVTKDVLPYQIVGGVPAREISKRFSDDVIQRLIKTEWWECGYDFICSLPTDNINAFLENYKLIPSKFETYSIEQ
jgi:acetyltransferase-like isoleucine patch superfamily enzyme